VDEFWRRQRETLSDEYRRKLEVIEEEAKTLLFYCTHGHELDPSDEDFVSLHDHIDLMQTFADEHGLISDSHFESPELEDWSPRVMVWSTEKEISQGYTPFWQDPLRFRLLTTSEGSATRLYCLYGVEGITDTHLAKFKFRIQEHQTASSERRRMHIIHESFRCYLCRFETTHGRKYPKEYL